MIVYDHISLRVTDLERAIAFYGEVLGLRLVSRREDGSQAVFGVDKALLVLFCREDYESVPQGFRGGTDHIAFCLDSETYDLVLERLKDGGLIQRGPTVNKGAHGDGLATYFYDPDGNELEIKKYPPKT